MWPEDWHLRYAILFAGTFAVYWAPAYLLDRYLGLTEAPISRRLSFVLPVCQSFTVVAIFGGFWPPPFADTRQIEVLWHLGHTFIGLIVGLVLCRQILVKIIDRADSRITFRVIPHTSVGRVAWFLLPPTSLILFLWLVGFYVFYGGPAPSTQDSASKLAALLTGKSETKVQPDRPLDLPLFIPFSIGIRWLGVPYVLFVFLVATIGFLYFININWQKTDITSSILFLVLLFFIIFVGFLAVYCLYFGGLMVTSDGIFLRPDLRVFRFRFRWDEIRRFAASPDIRRLSVILHRELRWPVHGVDRHRLDIRHPLEGNLGELVSQLNAELERRCGPQNG